MAAETSRKVSRAVRVVLALVALSAVISVRAAEQPASPGAEDTLRRQVEARFDVVPLRDGIALAGRTADRRIEIDRGVVLSRGVPLSGEELRRRFGADADLVLRLSYLDNDALRRLFAGTSASGASTSTTVPGPPTAAPAPPAPPAPPTPPAPPVFDRPSPAEAQPVFRRTGARLGIAKPIVIAADEEVTDGVFSLGGRVRVEGRVRDGVVVVGSDLTLGPTADVRGDVTVIGGTLSIAEGARHAGAVHHAEGASWPHWSWPTVGWSWFEPGGAASWLPLAGTTTRILLLGMVMAALAFFARGRVARIGAAAAAGPVRAGLIGLAAQVIFVPALIVVAIVMAITIVGLPFVAVVVPLAVCAMLASMVLGFTSLAARIGQYVTGNDTLVAVLAGLVIIVLPTFLARLAGVGPDGLRALTVALLVVGTLVEYVAWTVGLGAAVMTGLGRWAVVPPPVPPAPPVAGDPVVAPSAVL
jgi:hypothetical protein